MTEILGEDDPYDLVAADDRGGNVPDRANRYRNRNDLPRPSMSQNRERIAPLDQQKDRRGQRAQHDRNRTLRKNPKTEHHADENFPAQRTVRFEQRENRRVCGEQQERQQHVGQRFGRARRESVSAEYQHETRAILPMRRRWRPSTRAPRSRALCLPPPRRHARELRQRCARWRQRSPLRANRTAAVCDRCNRTRRAVSASGRRARCSESTRPIAAPRPFETARRFPAQGL